MLSFDRRSIPPLVLLSVWSKACSLPHAELRPDVVVSDITAPDAPMSDVVQDRPPPPEDVPCPSGQMVCNGRCIDTASDIANCGGCAVRCPASATCVEGNCRCPSGQTMCAGQCVNTDSDRAHCGMCGRNCASSEVCAAGACTASCMAPRTMCGPACVDTQTDALNCGMCGRTCPAGQSCVAGSCMLVCPAPTTACSGSCVNLQTDSSHCGACGRGCRVGMTCSGGMCVCTGGATLCGSTCVDLNTNAMHYGGCDRRCSMPDGGSAPGSCVAGMCGDGVCALGFHVCAGSCVSNSSPTSCGTRCTACPLVANGTPTCDGTNCGFECNRGFVMGGGGCVPGPTCGNGTLDAAETCDDGNATSGDGCDMNCQIEADAFVESCAQTPVTIPIRRNQVILLRAQSGTMNNGTGPAGCNADGNEVVAAVRAIDTGTLTIVATPVAPMGSWDLILRYGLGACPGDQCTDAGGGSGRSETATLSIATANQMVAVNVDGNRGSDNGTFTVRLELR